MIGIDTRYALCPISPGGLLLDLRSGALFELNEAAAFVWELRLAGKATDTIAEGLVRRFGLPSEDATLDVEAALGGVSLSRDSKIPGDFSYERRGDTFVFSFRGNVVLVVDDRGERLVPHGPSQVPRDRLRYFVRAIAPKLLTLRGQVVLHAAAVTMGDRIFAVSGLSGAGKTTTARALVLAGAHPVSEDKLLLQVSATGVDAVLTGERAIDEWADRAASDLSENRVVPLGVLDAVMTGSRAPVAEIGFIDAGRRMGTSIAAKPLSLVELAGSVFRSGFHGSDDAAYWRRQLDAAGAVGRSTKGFALTMPESVSLLETAVVRVREAGTFRS